MCGITSGRSEVCNDNIGGLKAAYLFNFTHYKDYLMSFNGANLLSYPETTIFKYELLNDSNTLNADLEESEEGNSYKISLSLKLKGVKDNRNNIFDLLGQKIGVITESRLGHFQIIGLRNGCKVKKINETLGGARADFSGFEIDIEAKELQPTFFIDNLQSTGFILEGNNNNNNYIFQDGNNFIFQDGNNLIFN